MAKRKKTLPVIHSGKPNISCLSDAQRKAFIEKILAEIKRLSSSEPTK